MFILSSISSSLEFWSVNHTSIYENSESNVFKNINVLGKISNNWLNNLMYTNDLIMYTIMDTNDLMEQIYTRFLSFVDNNYWQYYNVLILLQ